MRTLHRLLILVLIVVPSVRADQPATGRPAAAEATGGMVVTVHPLATQAALDAMRGGGNAIDAAVAAALTLGVVDGHNSGIGGGCFMLVRTADGRTFAYDGREMAPAAATRDMYLRGGKADTSLSQTGPLAVGVPGSLAVYDRVVKAHGRRALADLLRPAADIAERGFPIDATYAQRLLATQLEIAQFPETRRVLFRPDGTLPSQGDELRQPDLARSYRAIADEGIGWFYGGAFARSVGEWMKANGGIVTADDFAQYQPRQREPVVSQYRGHTIIGFPPPSSGGVHVAQILSTLEAFDIADLHRRDPALRVHVIAEAMKLAFADRAHWLGDPDFVKVPRGLADAEYGRQLAARIDVTKAMAVPSHGQPPGGTGNAFGATTPSKHTTHVATADAEGNWVALTTTVNTEFGSKVIVPGTGIILNNQMDDFSAEPGVPNAFGLVGAEANAIAPRKRPLSSMSPTIVLDPRGRPMMTLGAAGGPRIITQVVLVVSNVIDLKDDLPAALARPRFHQQWKPDAVWIENTFEPEVLTSLRKLGHTLDVQPPRGATQAILRLNREEGEVFVGVPEPRLNGQAAGPSSDQR